LTKETSVAISTDIALPTVNSRGFARLLLRPEEAADAIGVSRARFYELLAAGKIKSIKIGRSRRIPVEELQGWVSEELEKQSN
jgi:excisionase family DNA binding protein